MRGNKLFLFIVIILGLIVITPAFAQRTSKQEKFNENHSPFGRRKKERANMRHSLFAGKKLFRRGKSHGNADDFASNSGHAKRGFLSRVFSRGGGSERNASLRKTKPGNVQNREQKGLFHWARTRNKNDHQRIQRHQNKERRKSRIRGNSAFSKKKS